VIAKAIELARSKGTLYGMKLHTEVMDTEVKQIVRPPQGTFASRILTKEELDAWLRQMPQIRVYLGFERGVANGLWFIGHDTAIVPSQQVVRAFLDRNCFARFDAGRALLGRKARLYRDGVETPLLIWDISTEQQIEDGLIIERVSIPGKATPLSLFCGGYLDRRHADTVETPAKIVTYQLDTTYEHSVSALSMTSVETGLTPIDVRSERIYATGYGDSAYFCGRFLTERPPLSGQTTKQLFWREDLAKWMIYDRVILHDPAVAAQRVEGAWSFLNYSRLGFAKFTAKVVIDLKDKIRRSALISEGFLSSATFLVPRDTTKYDRARLAVRVSKAARDRILTTHKLTRPQTFDDGIPFNVDFTREPRVPFRL
jgi:hypothetical protein